MQESDIKKVYKDLVEENKLYYLRKYCPVFEPEYHKYTIKTRPPHYVFNWRLNFFRRSREQELKDEAMRAARLKCHETANAFTKCSIDNPRNEGKMCKHLFNPMKQCFQQEFEVEMDKRRRDMTRNTEWWWQNIYDEDGEVGEQAGEPKNTYIEKTLDACEWVLDKLDGVLYKHDK